MKKIGLLAMVLVMALGGLGIGYAHWSETLTMSGTAETGDINPYFSCIAANDDWLTQLDPYGWGQWNYGSGLWEGARKTKHIGRTCLAGGTPNQGDLIMTVTNAYPTYYGSGRYCIENSGTVPVNVYGIYLMSVGGNSESKTFTTPMLIEPDTIYYVDVDDGANPRVRTTSYGAMKDDFTFQVSSLVIGAQIDPVTWLSGRTPTPVTQLWGDISIHMENGCKQAMTAVGEAYFFSIDIDFWNYPEGAVGDPGYGP